MLEIYNGAERYVEYLSLRARMMCVDSVRRERIEVVRERGSILTITLGGRGVMVA
jgi:hypothetical protein